MVCPRRRRFTMCDNGYEWRADSKVKLLISATEGSYLYPTSSHYYSRQIAGTNLPTARGWIAWLARPRVYVHNLLQSYYTMESKGSRGNLTEVEGPKILLDANELTAPYIIGWELNLRKLPVGSGNPQPSEQLRPMTIKVSASTKTAARAYFQGQRFESNTLVRSYYTWSMLESLKAWRTIPIAKMLEGVRLAHPFIVTWVTCESLKWWQINLTLLLPWNM